MESSAGALLLKLFVVLLLLLANAFFVGSEYALVSVRRSRISALAHRGNHAAAAVLRLIEDPKIFISVVQFGVTLASLGLGWIGQSTLANEVFLPLFGRVIPGAMLGIISAHALAGLIAFALVTFFTVVLGEITPKTIALEKTYLVALAVARPLEFFYAVFKPFISLLNYSSGYFLRLLGFKGSPARTAVYSEEELRHIVSMSFQSGVLNEHERRVIHNIFDFPDKVVREVMVPRPEVAALDASLDYEAAAREFVKSGYSRIPVYSGQLDNVVGVAHSKDLMSYSVSPNRRGRRFDLQAVSRKPLFIPDTAALDEALKQMQASKSHFGIVVDEHGSFEGIVTLEDLLEEIVGEIQDEHDEATELEMVHPEPDGSFTVTGGIPVREANRALNLGLPEDDGYNTLAGFLLSRSGKVLAKGEQVQYGSFTYTIETVDKRRIVRVRIKPLASVQEVSGTSS
jgi:putative hemolysin